MNNVDCPNIRDYTLNEDDMILKRCRDPDAGHINMIHFLWFLIVVFVPILAIKI